MRVLILFSSSDMGGAERSLSRMACASRNIQFELATIQGEGAWCDWIRKQGQEPIVLGKNSSKFLTGFFAWRYLFWYLRKNPVQLIYVCGVRASLWLRMFRFLIPDTKIVHGVRWNPASKSRLDYFFRLVEKNCSRLIDAWITNSAIAKSTLVQRCGIAEKRIQVIYNGIERLPVDLPEYQQRPLEILTVANLNPRKGYREYLISVKQVIDQLPEARFVFIGRDDMQGEIQLAIQAAGLNEYIRYEGFQADISWWLKRARIFVLPSLWNEGCPTSILEAMSYSIPCVAFSIDGIAELFKDQKQGYLLPKGNYSAMAEAILSLLKNPEQSMLMGQSAQQRIQHDFTLSQTVALHENFFTNLVCA